MFEKALLRRARTAGVPSALVFSLFFAHSGNVFAQNRDVRPSNTATTAQAAVADVALPESWAKTMKWRSIGPATMGGRITAISVYEKDPTTFWVATAGGGLLKTVNNGTTFEHQFDKESTVSIGDVCVAPSDPNILYVGTGEAQPRNSVSYGDGVYKSVDGGKSWTNVGLKGTFQIGKVLVHPTDPNIVYVGALGRLYGPSEERGLFQSVDGGKTWKNVLSKGDRAGVIDMAFQPGSPNTMIVCLWERARDGFDSNIGKPGPQDGYDSYDPSLKYGPASGMYKTTDGGKTWARLGKGLPTGNFGRIGISFMEKTPATLFAVVDCDKIGMGTPPSRAYAGIRGEDAKTTKGAGLIEVTDNSPASKAGLKTTDIVTAVDSLPVATYNELLAAVRGKKTGDKIALTVVRDGKPLDKPIIVTLEDRPDEAEAQRRLRPTFGWLSLVAAPTTDATPRLRVSRVLATGNAGRAGVEEGDILVSLDGKKLEDAEDLDTLLREKKETDIPVLTVERDGKTREIKIALSDPNDPRKKRPYTFQYFGQQANIQEQQGPNSFEYGGVYRSDDAGESWTRINSINIRPMYFSVIKVDPMDDRFLYLAGVSMYRSKDGGKTFTPDAGNSVHADQHSIWVNPKDGRHLIVGCDGGTYVSYDRSEKWDHLAQVAIGQPYHVTFDRKFPYNVYAGYQDNGSWGGPTNSLSGVGATNEHWKSVGGGDGFVCRVDPTDNDIVFTESQNGSMGRLNLRTGERASIRPRAERGRTYRFNWNTPFVISHHNPKVLYAAGNYVFKSIKSGDEMRAISPEITRTTRGSATAFSESPLNPDILWVGSDDGGLHISRDGGQTWKNVSDTLLKAGVSGPRWVSTLEASRFVEGRAYICLDAHRSDDDKPYLFVTEDFGASWKPITANLPAFGSTRVLREDLKNPNLLLCGTEFAAFASINRGKSWTKINGANLPTVAVHELAIQPDADELIAATHGRSIWVMDIAPLRQMTAQTVQATTAALLEPTRMVRWRRQPSQGAVGSGGNKKYYAENPTRGAQIHYVLAKKAGRVTLAVQDINGQTIRQLPVKNEAGLNVASWDGTAVRALGVRRRGVGAAEGGVGTGVTGTGGILPATARRRNRPVNAGQGTVNAPATTTIPPTTAPTAQTGTTATTTASGDAGTTTTNMQNAGAAISRLQGIGGTPVAAGVYRLVLTVDGEQFTQLIRVENDPTLSSAEAAAFEAMLVAEAEADTLATENAENKRRNSKTLPAVD